MIISNQNTKASVTRVVLLIVASLVATFIMSFSKKSVIENEDLVYETGKASYYGHPFIGRKTASGEVFTEHLYTCAHKSLPFGTKLKVTNLSTGTAIIVKVNDRGPFVKHRIVDLSIRAAKELGLMKSGVANVSIEIVNSRYSDVGNTNNMDRIFIDGAYAYIDKNDSKTFNDAYEYALSQTETSSPNPSTVSKEIESVMISEPYTKEESLVEDLNIESKGTNSSTSELKVEN